MHRRRRCVRSLNDNGALSGIGASDLKLRWECCTRRPALAGFYLSVHHAESLFFNLLLSLFIFWLFGRSFESQRGTPYFLRFVGFAAVGAAVLAVPINLLLNPVLESILLFKDQTLASGPNPVIDAFLVHLAIVAPRSNILLGFVFPVQTRQVVYFVLGIELLFGLMTGMATISVTLGGIAMGYLLTTGKWRPSAWNLPKRSNTKRRPSHLRVVKDDEPTLH